MWLCSQCGKPFNSCLKLLQHRRVHSVFRPFICYVGQCTKSFSTVSAYQCHRRRHVDQRLYSCGKCRLKFLTLLHRKRHNCGAKANQCNICLQRFHHVLPLKYHIKLEHPSAQRVDSYKREQSSVSGKSRKYNKSLKSLYSARESSKKTKSDAGCDKDGNKILLKITAGRSTTIISPKRERILKNSEQYLKIKSKKKQKRNDKEKKNGIILSIKNIPKLKKSYICKRVNGLPVEKEPVKQVGELKLKIKTYPSLTVEQKIQNDKKIVSNLGSKESSPKTISARANNYSEKIYAEGERTPNRKLLSDSLSQSPSPYTGESKVRNGIVIVKDKSGRFQAEQLQSAKMRKRERDNVFDSFSDIGVWKVMPSPRTDNPTDILKLRLSPQKPLRLDSGLDQTFESAAARYLDVSVKTKAVYNSGDDSDIFEPGLVLDKDSENGGQGVNDSGIEVLSSSTIRSNGNSVHSGILDESSPNYLNTEDSLLSLDSPVAEALSKSEHTLCHKCGGIIIETNNNAYSPRRCRCYMSNPNSPFQTPMSPVKNNIPLSDSNERTYFENKKKTSPHILRGNSEEERVFESNFMVQKSASPEAEVNVNLNVFNKSETSADRPTDMETCQSPSKSMSGEPKNEGKSLCLKIQLGNNPSVERVSECISPRKLSPDKQARQKSPDKQASIKSPDKQAIQRSPDKQVRQKSPDKQTRQKSPDKQTRQRSPDKQTRHKSPDKQTRQRSPDKQARQKSPDKSKVKIADKQKQSPDKQARQKSPEKQAKQRSPDKSKVKSGDKQHLVKQNDSSLNKEVSAPSLSPKDKDYGMTGVGLNVLPVVSLESDNEDAEDTQDLTKLASKHLFSSYKSISLEDTSINELGSVVSTEISENEQKSDISETHQKSNISESLDKDQMKEKTDQPQEDASQSEVVNSSQKVSPQKMKENMLVVQDKENEDNLKTAKKKPLFKKQKSSKDNGEESAIQTETKDIPKTEENKSKNKKPLFKKRTHSVDYEEIPKKNKKPLFKRTVSAIESQEKDKSVFDVKDANSTNKKGSKDGKTNSKKSDKNENRDSNEKSSKQTYSSVKESANEQLKDSERKQNVNSKDDQKCTSVKESENEQRNDSKIKTIDKKDIVVMFPSSEDLLVENKEPSKSEVKTIIRSPIIEGTCLVADKDDSLQEVPTLPDVDEPITSPKPVTSPLNPFQQQFLSFLSTASRIPNSTVPNKKENTSKKSKKKVSDKDKKEKENICDKKKEAVIDLKPQQKDKEKKRKKGITSDEVEKKSDTFSWLNIFSQMNSGRNETEANKTEENKDDGADFKADLAVINQKMDIQKGDDSDSLDVDDIFESKNLSNLQPLQNPKDILLSETKPNGTDRKKSVKKRKRHPTNIDSDFSALSSEEGTIDMHCCHKKHDPNFNPFIDSDDDFMPSKPLKRRESTGRRAKKFRSSGSISSECDSKITQDSKFDEKLETGSTISRSKRSKQGQKSCCPCCLGSFGDIGDSDDEYWARQPSYKLPRNHKQFVKSSLRLMQLQEKIHRLFINLFPDCVDVISKAKIGTEEFEVLIEDVLFGLESNEIQFEPSCLSSSLSSTDKPLLSPQGLPCHVQDSQMSQPTHALLSHNVIPKPSEGLVERDALHPADGVILIQEHLNTTPHDLNNLGADNGLMDKVTTGNHTSAIANTVVSITEHTGHTLNNVEESGPNVDQMVTDNSGTSDVKSGGSLIQLPGAVNMVNSQDAANSLQASVGDQLTVPENLELTEQGDKCDHNDYDYGYVEDSNYMDCGSSVQSHLEITIDLSAARVSVCREPKHCLQRLQGQLVKLVKYLIPDMDLKNYFYRNIDNIEFLIDLMIVANDQENKQINTGDNIVLSSDSESEDTLVKPDSESDILDKNKVMELNVDKMVVESAESSLSVLPSLSEQSKKDEEENTTKTEGIPFEMLIKSQRESLKKDVFQFEEVDTAAMIKTSEKVLSNIETLSKIAKCTARTKRTKSRDSRLRKRTAEEKRTLFVQEKVLNSQNSTIVCHSKKLCEPTRRSEKKSKHSENPKQRFLSELNLGDRQDIVQNNPEQNEIETEKETEKTTEKEKATEENLLTEKTDLDDMDCESKRKSSDKNIFELMQPSQSAENVSS